MINYRVDLEEEGDATDFLGFTMDCDGETGMRVNNQTAMKDQFSGYLLLDVGNMRLHACSGYLIRSTRNRFIQNHDQNAKQFTITYLVQRVHDHIKGRKKGSSLVLGRKYIQLN